MSFAELNRAIWSIAYNKLVQSNKLDYFMKEGTYFLLKNCYTIVNINGINFEEFSRTHQFIKPNDIRGKYLMDHCAKALTKQFEPHILLSYGFSDQFCFVINRSTNFCGRNLVTILSTILSNFTSNYVFNWRNYFGDNHLQYAPAFKASTLLIPNEENLIKYLITKQHECYILNLNSTLYSALIGEYRRYILNEDQFSDDKNSSNNDLKNVNISYRTEELNTVKEKRISNDEALKRIENEIDTIAKINEYLFQNFNINYNNELELFRKGTFIHPDNLNSIKSLNKKFDAEFLLSVLSSDQVNRLDDLSSKTLKTSVMNE